MNPFKIMILRIVAFLLILSCQSRNVEGQWTVTSLHPIGQISSEARGAGGNNQVGNVLDFGAERASLWSGTVATWVNLDPSGSLESRALGASATSQVGWADVNGKRRASLWSGNAASWVDLNPTDALQSQALGASNENQVGWIFDGAIGRASLWSDTAASWVDLHPAGANGSEAAAVWGKQQTGWTIVNGAFHASIWSGSAASWVDLHPAGAVQSQARGIYDDYQVGFADINGNRRASLWSGSAASWIDLHPSGATSSAIQAAFGPIQAGEARVAFEDHASVWSGTAKSWIDLHALLSTDFEYSYALSVSSDGIHYYIAGLGYNSFDGRFEALLWTRPATAIDTVQPIGRKLLDGIESGSQLSDTTESDDIYYALDPSPTNNPAKQIVEMILVGESTVASPSSFGFQLEAGMIGDPSGDVMQTISLWDESNQQWVLLDTRSATTADTTVFVSASGILDRFVHPITDEIIAKVKWTSPVFSGDPFNWSIDIDQLVWFVGN